MHECTIEYERQYERVKEFNSLFRRVRTIILTEDEQNFIGGARRHDYGKRGYVQPSILDTSGDMRDSDTDSSNRNSQNDADKFPF